MVPQLPAEIIDYIIDFLWDYPRALRTCARLSHAWLASSRYHLFSRITISNDTAIKLLTSALTEPHLDPFFKLTSCLTIKASPRPQRLTRRVRDVLNLLPVLLRRRVSSLDAFLDRAREDASCPKLKMILLVVVPMKAWRLSTLSLENCSFYCLLEFTHFMHAFPCLVDVTLSGVEMRVGISPAEGTSLPRPSLRRLALLEWTTFDIVAWFLAPPCASPIAELVISPQSLSLRVLERFLQHQGAALQSLSLHYYLPWSLYAVPQDHLERALARSTNLQSLALVIDSDWHEQIAPEDMERLLRRVPDCTSLRALRITCVLSPSGKVDWAALLRTLFCRARFPRLAAFTLVIYLERVAQAYRNLWHAKFRRRLQRALPGAARVVDLAVFFEFRQVSLSGREEAVFVVELSSSKCTSTLRFLRHE